MYVENIIRDLQDIIHDVKQAGCRAYDNRRDAERAVSNSVHEEAENTYKAYDTVCEGLIEASHALDKANDDFLNIEEMLNKIVEDIKMEELSHKVQSK
jgi:hypothetical protein